MNDNLEKTEVGESRKKLFLENILVYGLGSAMNMIIPFCMLPIVTRLLPSSKYYGINDIVTIFVSVGSAVVMMGMYDAMYRFYFDNEDDKYHKKVCSSTLFTIVVTGFFAMLIALFFRQQLALLLFSDTIYSSLIVIGGFNIWVTCINTIVAAPTRIKNEKMRYILIQTLTPIISYSFSIPLILNGEYVYALPMSSLCSNTVVCIIFAVLNRDNFDVRSFSFNILKPMLRFGIPLMPVFLFFWILSSVGNIVITNILGLKYTGIYAASGKLAAASQLIYSAFSGGWQYFAFKTMRDKDYIQLISRVFDYLSAVSFFATALLTLLIKPIFLLILSNEYIEGIAIVPALFLAPLIMMLRQTIGMHFQVKKMSILGTSTIGFGAVVAVILYFFLIPKFGIRGAAIASLSGYTASLMITIIILIKMRLIFISKRFFMGSSLILVLLVLHMSYVNIFYVNAVAMLTCFILILLYHNDLVQVIKGATLFLKKSDE